MPLLPTTPELAALDVFVSVVELGSLSKAARAHHLTQPSVSSRIASLEAQLGLTLLERSPTGSVPTAAGALVAGWAGQVLQSAAELTAGVAALKARRSGRLRVAASLTIAEYLLPAWLETFLRNRPDSSIALDVHNSAEVLRRLEAGRADLGFIESPMATPSMEEHVVARDRLVVLVGRSHPWAGRGSVSLEEFAATPLVLRETGSGTRDALESVLALLGHGPPRSALVLGSTSAVRGAVLTGHSPAVLSDRAVAADLAAGGLVRIDVPGLMIERRLRAVWPTGRQLPPLALALLAELPSV